MQRRKEDFCGSPYPAGRDSFLYPSDDDTAEMADCPGPAPGLGDVPGSATRKPLFAEPGPRQRCGIGVRTDAAAKYKTLAGGIGSMRCVMKGGGTEDRKDKAAAVTQAREK